MDFPISLSTEADRSGSKPALLRWSPNCARYVERRSLVFTPAIPTRERTRSGDAGARRLSYSDTSECYTSRCGHDARDNGLLWGERPSRAADHKLPPHSTTTNSQMVTSYPSSPFLLLSLLNSLQHHHPMRSAVFEVGLVELGLYLRALRAQGACKLGVREQL